MKIFGLLTALAVGSADAGQNYLGVIIGVSVVTALITSWFVLTAFGKPNKQNDKSQTKSAAAVVPLPNSSAVSQTQNGISDEVAAVIAAAVASMSTDGMQYRIKHICRVPKQRSAWAAAGLAESTRPF